MTTKETTISITTAAKVISALNRAIEIAEKRKANLDLVEAVYRSEEIEWKLALKEMNEVLGGGWINE